MDAASWKAVERKARLAGNGLHPCPEAQHRGRPLFRLVPGCLQLRATARSSGCEHSPDARSRLGPGRLQSKATARSSGCEHSPDARSRLAQRERPRGSNPALPSLQRATAIPCGRRLVLYPLGCSASVMITWIEYLSKR